MSERGFERLRQHPTQPLTFEGKQPHAGYEWLGATMNAIARVQAEMLFALFAVGQAGALFRTKPGDVHEFLDRIEVDLADFKDAATFYVQTVEGIVANCRRNLEEKGAQ